MNIQQLIQHCLLAASLAGAAVCLAALFAYHFRNQLRKLHERWLGLGPLGRFATLGFVTVFVVYGSTKSPTNDLAGTMGFPGEMSTGGTGVSPVQTGNPGTILERTRCPFSQAGQSHLQLTTDNQQLTTLPTAVSLEPNVSMVSYGLTPSNSFLIAWQNACVNRSATNRIDASVELFSSGAITITTQRPGEAPSTSNQAPIYLVCGPYKVVVTSPGIYSFPLEVLTEYTARTYPIALPLSIAYDDGYRGGGESGSSSFAVPPRQAPRLLGAFVPHIYPIFMSPGIYVTPISVRLQEAQGTLISLWANVSGAARWAYRSFSGLTRLRFTAPSVAEIVEARVADTVEIFLRIDNGEYGCQLPIENDHSGCLCGCAFGGECTCGSDCPWCHHDEDNDNGQPSDDPTP